VCVKVTNIFIGLKKTCLGVLDRGDRDKDNETGLKERGEIEMSTTVLHSRAALSLEYLPSILITSAPWSANNPQQAGAAITVASSTTIMPASNFFCGCWVVVVVLLLVVACRWRCVWRVCRRRRAD